MSLSDEQRAVIEAARGIDWDRLDRTIGALEGHACSSAALGDTRRHIYGHLEAFAECVQVLRQACTMLLAAETRELTTASCPGPGAN